MEGGVVLYDRCVCVYAFSVFVVRKTLNAYTHTHTHTTIIQYDSALHNATLYTDFLLQDRKR